MPKCADERVGRAIGRKLSGRKRNHVMGIYFEVPVQLAMVEMLIRQGLEVEALYLREDFVPVFD